MPRGDRSGPRGMGAITGRGAGFCGGHEAAETGTSGRGLGGRRHGWCNWFRGLDGEAGPPTGNSRFAEHADMLKKQLDEVSRRVDALEKK